MKTNYCPWCMSKIDYAILLNGSFVEPEPDDFTMCNYCGKFAKYDNDIGLIRSSSEDMDDHIYKEMLIMKIEWLEKKKHEKTII